MKKTLMILLILLILTGCTSTYKNNDHIFEPQYVPQFSMSEIADKTLVENLKTLDSSVNLYEYIKNSIYLYDKYDEEKSPLLLADFLTIDYSEDGNELYINYNEDVRYSREQLRFVFRHIDSELKKLVEEVAKLFLQSDAQYINEIELPSTFTKKHYMWAKGGLYILYNSEEEIIDSNDPSGATFGLHSDFTIKFVPEEYKKYIDPDENENHTLKENCTLKEITESDEWYYEFFCKMNWFDEFDMKWSEDENELNIVFDTFAFRDDYYPYSNIYNDFDSLVSVITSDLFGYEKKDYLNDGRILIPREKGDDWVTTFTKYEMWGLYVQESKNVITTDRYYGKDPYDHVELHKIELTIKFLPKEYQNYLDNLEYAGVYDN